VAFKGIFGRILPGSIRNPAIAPQSSSSTIDSLRYHIHQIAASPLKAEGF